MDLGGGAATIVLGFREESWPKGHGYLYWRTEPGGKEVRLCNCDLYELGEDVVSRMFEEALIEVSRQLGIEPSDVSGLSLLTENMSTLAERMLRNMVERMINRSR